MAMNTTPKLKGTVTGKFDEDWEGANGAAQVIDGALATKVTVSGTDTYIGEALPGTLQATATWRCQKIDVNGSITWADGDSDFDNTATDLTAHSYL